MSLQYLGNWYTVYGNINFVTEEGDNCIRASYKSLNETAVYARNVGIEGYHHQLVEVSILTKFLYCFI